MKRIIVFASGSGTNFINIYKNVKKANIVLLVSNNSNSGAISFAKKNKINYKIINIKRCKSLSDTYKTVLNEHKPDLILLAGFMKKIPVQIIKQYKNKIMNIHPSLLPKFGGKGFYGIKVHEAVIKSNETITGATVHFVNENYDEGAIIKQKKVDVLKNDDAISLSKRVLEAEYRLYLNVVNLYCDDKIKIINNKVLINESN